MVLSDHLVTAMTRIVRDGTCVCAVQPTRSFGSHMSNPGPRLETSIRSYLGPYLREDGFTGSGRTFHRLTNGLIQVVNVQGSRYGGQFAINLAVQPSTIPDVLGNTPDLKKITESHCEFRRRLAESGADQWWVHDMSQASMDAAVATAAEVYIRIGRPVLDAVSSPTSPLLTVSPQDFANDDFNFYGFGSTKVRMALALARLRKIEGRLAESRAFAAHGLANIGPAVVLRREFELLSGTNG